MNPVASPPPMTAPPRKRRWLRRVLVILLIFVGLPAGYYFYAAWSLNAEIARAIAETDLLDPRWRFEDMEADRKVLSDEENSYVQIVKVIGLLGRGGRGTPGGNMRYPEVFGELPATAELNVQQIEMIREAFEKCPEALVEARKLKDFPHGRFPITFDRAGIWALLPDHQEVRSMYDLLRHDAMLRAHVGDPDEALESCQALLNAERSLAEDPLLYSLEIRFPGHTFLSNTLERILAQAYPKDRPMKQLQDRLRAERDDLPSQWLHRRPGRARRISSFFRAVAFGQDALDAGGRDFPKHLGARSPHELSAGFADQGLSRRSAASE
jgi:hypothetical protein